VFFLTVVKIFLDQIDIEIETFFSQSSFLFIVTLHVPLQSEHYVIIIIIIGVPYIGNNLKTFVSYRIPCLISLIYVAYLVVPISFLSKLTYCIRNDHECILKFNFFSLNNTLLYF
jgi:hypothetical protein